MTTYYGLYGQKVQYLASDPTDVQIGQVWYNSTSAVLKVRQEVATNAWATGGTMANARYGAAGFGTQTAALVAGGINGPTYKPQTELYNGTTWTANPTGMNANKYGIAGAGTQTAGVAFGSDGAPGGQTELWNGSVWTNNPTGLNFGGEALAGCGTQTAALAIGGLRPVGPLGVASNKTESYNGTSWTSVTSMNTARSSPGGAGTQTLAAAFGGDVPPVTGATELWNGTSWITSTSMSSARSGPSGAGTQANGLAFAGYTGTTGSAATEEFTGASAVAQTITTS